MQREDLQWHIAARPSDIAKPAPKGRGKTAAQKREHRKASVRAKVEHPFRVIKRQFGLLKVRFRGLAKNTAHVVTLFALSNLWMARRKLMAMGRSPSAKRMRREECGQSRSKRDSASRFRAVAAVVVRQSRSPIHVVQTFLRRQTVEHVFGDAQGPGWGRATS